MPVTPPPSAFSRHARRLATALLPLAGACLAACRDRTASPVHRSPPDSLTAQRAGTLGVPADSTIPSGPLGDAIRRGRALVLDTRDSLPHAVGNALRCTSCHLDAGTRPYAMTWHGVYARFPQYRSRSATVIRLEDRINDCFVRSLNGRALPDSGRDMRDIVSYMAFLSQKVPVGGTVPGQGIATLTPLPADATRGAAIFASTCARCHGAEGQGTPLATPVWGARSYNIGAGMARLRTAAAFIRRNMPYDQPGTLSDQQAFDVAAYLDSRPRPDFPGKEHDWPNGDAPADVAYRTLGLGRDSRPR